MCGKKAKRFGYRLGKRRYRCCSCGHIFFRHPSSTVTYGDFQEFHRYVTGAHSRKGSGYALRTIARRFSDFLDHPLTASDVWTVFPPKTTSVPRPWVYGCDGKWLGRVGVFFIHRNVTTKENLWWSFIPSETYEAIHRDLDELSIRLGDHCPVGAVSDWKGSIVAAVASHFGTIPHQRCLAHVDRQAKRFLPLHSPYEATQALRKVAVLLMLVEKPNDPHVWHTSLARWEHQYGAMLKEKTIAPTGLTRHWWYTHGNLRRAWRLLTHDPTPLFVFLTNHLIPKTNNALEGVNSNLKQKLGDHRGMSVQRQAAFLSWYLAFTRSKSDNDLRKLWVYQKSKFSRS